MLLAGVLAAGLRPPAVARTVPRLLRRIPGSTATERRRQVLTTVARPRGVVSTSLPDGSPVRLSCTGDLLSSRLFWQGFTAFEPEALPLFATFARDAEVVLDVGANVGVYALVTAAANPGARIFCFEPVSVVMSQLARNLDVNGVGNAVCVRAAAGARTGTVPVFYRPGVVEQVASTRPGHRMSWERGPWACEYVESVRLDDFVEQAGIGSVDLVKIDVETAEPEVLEGMGGVIARDRPHIFCEVFPQGWIGAGTYQRIEALLDPHGYHYYLLTPDGPQAQDRVRGHEAHWNQLFSTCSPAEVAARASS